MLLIFVLLFLPLTAAHDQHVLSAPTLRPKYNLVDHKLVREIDQLRQDWGIKGAAVAVVQRDDEGGWKEDKFGVGVADARGNLVTENVSSCVFSLVVLV